MFLGVNKNLQPNQNNRDGFRGMAASQRGVGMVEVMVAMLLLAIGVLGYSVLQIRAVEATSEALSRSNGLLILRGLGEAIRANDEGQGSYAVAVRGFNTGSAPIAPTTSCDNSACTAANFASWDAYLTALSANRLGMRISMTTCPGIPTGATIQRQCLFASWNTTTPSIGVGAADCMSTLGIYNASASCVMMEVY